MDLQVFLSALRLLRVHSDLYGWQTGIMSKGSNPFDYCDGFYVHVQNRSVTSNWLRCERGMQCCHLSAGFFISFILRLSSTAALLLCFCHSVQHVSPACWQETLQDTWPMYTVWIMFKTQLWSSLLDGKVATLLLYFLYLILVTCVGKQQGPINIWLVHIVYQSIDKNPAFKVV